MPESLLFPRDEIEDEGTATITNAGIAYIAKKHRGKKVRWLILKTKESNKSDSA